MEKGLVLSNEPNVVFRGDRFSVERLQISARDNSLVGKDVVRHPGAVVILPLLSDERVCLIQNLRPTVGLSLVELPAGTCEPPEPVGKTARRELIEETGFRAGILEPLLEFYATPGICDERMYLFLATDLVEGEHAREATEQIQNLIVSIEEAITMIDDGRIQDGKTIVGLLYYQWMREKKNA